jgi:murein DD-endopeptidase MepM/ murein hydrolase activator NlpD
MRIVAIFGELRLSLVVAPAEERACDAVYSPYAGKRRGELAAVEKRLRSNFGDYRSSYVKGHRHAGVDLTGRYEETVYPICRGVVVAVAYAFPHRTVYVMHELPDGTTFFSAYKHVEDPKVGFGDWVEADTPIARLFTRAELKAARFGRAPNHVHLEIRKTLADEGVASFTSMSKRELLEVLYDPLQFMRGRMAAD